MIKLDSKQMIKNVDKYYSFVVCYHLNDNKEIILQDSHKGKCRFCGKGQPNVTFEKVAHAIPHFIGNQTLKSEYECDECNQLFSMYESQFAEYMKLHHVFAKVNKGGGKIPKYKNNSSEQSSISIDTNGFNIKCVEGEQLKVDLDIDNKSFSVKGKRSYIPQYVYKALTKMALTIMPESELKYFEHTLSWLQGQRECGPGLKMIERLYQARFPFNSCMIFKRKNDNDDVPAYIFGLAYFNFFIQIPIPLCDKDFSKQRKSLTMPYIPTPLDEEKIPCFCGVKDLSSTEKAKDEDISMVFSFGAFEEMSGK